MRIEKQVHSVNPALNQSNQNHFIEVMKIRSHIEVSHQGQLLNRPLT